MASKEVQIYDWRFTLNLIDITEPKTLRLQRPCVPSVAARRDGRQTPRGTRYLGM